MALEHLTTGDANNARFGLMLTDNVVELMLHQLAKDKKNELKMFSYRREEFKHAAALERALGRPFESKVKFAKVLGTFPDEIAESISILHSLRHEERLSPCWMETIGGPSRSSVGRSKPWKQIPTSESLATANSNHIAMAVRMV